MEVSGPRELAFFPSTARGCVYKGFDYESHSGSKAVTMEVNTDALPSSPSKVVVYYNGGGLFVDASKQRNVEILARYSEPKADIQDNDMAAAVYCKVGKGCNDHFDEVISQIKPNDRERKLFLRACLEKMGLKVNEGVDGAVPRLTPIFVASPIDPRGSNKLLTTLKENLDFVSPNTFEDINDTFVLHDENDTDITEDLNMDSDGEQTFDQVISAPKHIKFWAPMLSQNQHKLHTST
ncbi:hypothetical protein CJJ09_005309 [Candidozyma auris]|nr:hypothetical protein CJJ09_005309 [[Candida] auris]